MADTTVGVSMSPEQACTECHKRLSAKLPGFDPTIIIAIITAILKMIGVCGASPTEVKRQAGAYEVLTHLRLRRALREEGIRPLSPEMNAAVKAAIEIGDEATITELESFCKCCG